MWHFSLASCPSTFGAGRTAVASSSEKEDLRFISKPGQQVGDGRLKQGWLHTQPAEKSLPVVTPSHFQLHSRFSMSHTVCAHCTQFEAAFVQVSKVLAASQSKARLLCQPTIRQWSSCWELARARRKMARITTNRAGK